MIVVYIYIYMYIYIYPVSILAQAFLLSFVDRVCLQCQAAVARRATIALAGVGGMENCKETAQRKTTAGRMEVRCGMEVGGARGNVVTWSTDSVGNKTQRLDGNQRQRPNKPQSRIAFLLAQQHLFR
jgi:hypothetical protein